MIMIMKKTTLFAFHVILVTFFIFNSPTTTFAAKDAQSKGRGGKPAPKPSHDDPYKVVNEFCNQANTRNKAFCKRVLKSDPRSAFAKDNNTLLSISVDLAVGNANETKEFLTTLYRNNNATNPPLIAVLKDCTSAYDLCIGELLIISKEDPSTKSYDALMASDALYSCQDSLKAGKIADPEILFRHKIAIAYVHLCVDIAMTID